MPSLLLLSLARRAYSERCNDRFSALLIAGFATLDEPKTDSYPFGLRGLRSGRASTHCTRAGVLTASWGWTSPFCTPYVCGVGLLQLYDDDMCSRFAGILAYMRLLRGPQNVARFEFSPQNLAVRQRYGTFERAQCIEDKGRMPMPLGPLAGLILVVQYPDALVLKQNTILVTVRFHWIASKRARREEHDNASYYFSMHQILLL
jgi:hypothetical protein